jgi:Protein of unknown function (DUF2793)
MAEESAKLRIPYIAAAQAQKHVTHNEAMTLLDTLVQLSVLDKDLTAPPMSPTEGDCYIVAGGGGTATDAWVGWEQRVVRYIDGEWRSYLPGQGNGAGWLAWVLDEDAMYRYNGAAWALAGIEGPEGPQGPAGADGADGADGQSFQPDAAVDAIAGRAAYDDEPAAFSVLVVSDSTNGDLPTLYFKLSAANADWSDGITWAPEGDAGGGGATVRAATTANIAIATALNDGDTLDGVTLADGDLVLVKNQAAPEENGVYVAGASPSRAPGFTAYDDLPGVLASVQEGTANAETLWLCTSDRGGTIDSTALVLAGLGLPASVAQLEAGTDTLRAVTPGRQHRHPSAAKAWCYVTGGATPAIQQSYNITSITDLGVGQLRLTIADDFASANWVGVVTTGSPVGNMRNPSESAKTAGLVEFANLNHIPSLADPSAWNFIAFGDQ